METFIIEDGYTESAYIAPAPRLYAAARFTFRPLLPEERDAVEEFNRNKPSGEKSRNYCAVLAKKIRTWNLTDTKDQPLAISADSVRKLRPRLQDRFYSIIAGYESGDADPEMKISDREAEVTFDSIIGETAVAQARQEADLKN